MHGNCFVYPYLLILQIFTIAIKSKDIFKEHRD